MLESVLLRRKFVLTSVALLIAITGAVVPVVGTDFFPSADVGIIKLHVRAPRGTRLEGTEQILIAVEDRIREIIPPKELRTINETMFQMLGVFAEFERAMIQERVRAGLARAKAEGRQLGRPKIAVQTELAVQLRSARLGHEHIEAPTSQEA